MKEFLELTEQSKKLQIQFQHVSITSLLVLAMNYVLFHFPAQINNMKPFASLSVLKEVL